MPRHRSRAWPGPAPARAAVTNGHWSNVLGVNSFGGRRFALAADSRWLVQGLRHIRAEHEKTVTKRSLSVMMSEMSHAAEQPVVSSIVLVAKVSYDLTPGDLGAALVGRTLLYWWPTDGWQRGTVARLCPRGAFSHVVAYTRQTSALRGTADTLLDAASYGSRWVLLSPAPAGGVTLRPRAPRP